jgi:Carbohydrate binding domain.
LSTTSLRSDQIRWEIWVPGLEYEEIWTADAEYNKGDIVVYGGYAYTALTNNTDSIPSVNGLLQDTGDWELLNRDIDI